MFSFLNPASLFIICRSCVFLLVVHSLGNFTEFCENSVGFSVNPCSSFRYPPTAYDPFPLIFSGRTYRDSPNVDVNNFVGSNTAFPISRSICPPYCFGTFSSITLYGSFN